MTVCFCIEIISFHSIPRSLTSTGMTSDINILCWFLELIQKNLRFKFKVFIGRI